MAESRHLRPSRLVWLFQPRSLRPFNQPSSVAASADLLEERIYIADTGNNRVITVKLPGDDPLSAWNNVWMVVNLMRWECDGLVGYGDNQEAFWGSYLNSPAFRALK